MPEETVRAYQKSSRAKQTQMINGAVSKTGETFTINLEHLAFEERRQFMKVNARGHEERGVIFEVAVAKCQTEEALNRAANAGREQASNDYLNSFQPW